MIKGSEDTRYAYTNGLVRAKEAKLLKKNHFDRLLASEPTSFNAILADTPYAGYEDFLTGLEKVEGEERNFFNRYCQTPQVRQFVDWPEQIHNLKVKLKNGGSELLYPQTRAEVETWPEVIEEVARYAMEKEPFLLSTNLDKILCRYLYRTAQAFPFFARFFEIYFDLENIRSFFRTRHLENGREIFLHVFIDHGRIDKKLFIDNLSLHHGLLAKNFYNTPYADLIDMAGAYIESQGSFLRLERLCEERRLIFLSQTRFMTFGVEPLFGYYAFKMAEIKRLRQVYMGKINGIPAPELKESIADVW